MDSIKVDDDEPVEVLPKAVVAAGFCPNKPPPKALVPVEGWPNALPVVLFV